jgi:hypothetical protein
MKEGDLVKFVGHANFYKGRIGVICKLYSIHNVKLNGKPRAPDSALVYYAGAEKAGRASDPHVKSGLHPMALAELEAIDR